MPRLSAALASGALGIDKVVELTRFATPDREADLVRWAREVSCATVRRRGDLEARATREQVVAAERDLLICSFHHRLVHEYGWSIEREAGGGVVWRRADGTRHRAGPTDGLSPPRPAAA